MAMEEGNEKVQFPMSVHAFVPAMAGSLQPHGLSPARLLCSCDPQAENTWGGLPYASPGALLDRDQSASPALAGGFLYH